MVFNDHPKLGPRVPRNTQAGPDEGVLETNSEQETCEMRLVDGEFKRTGCEWDRWAYTCTPIEIRGHERGDMARLYNWNDARTQDDLGKPLYGEPPEPGYGASWLGASTEPESKEELGLHKAYLYCL